ncbi:hypothetical protein [Streptomyces sp. NPDC021224]|uniref:hypothetical protein n=1 Tax=unclassified Streptomyces TaxID=2593676 RepID=UPI0037A3959E
MSSIAGTWDVTVKSPVGDLAVVYIFTDSAGTVAGTASSEAETVPLANVISKDTAEGRRVTWKQSVTKPAKLNLEFDVTFVGDTLSGHSKVSRLLPKIGVTGSRRA